jgi:predicted small lipoprotein YifL
MNTTAIKTFRLAPALAALAVLAACGGGGGNGTPPAADAREVPASAGQSSAALVGYLSDLATKKDDTRDGLSLEKFSAPMSDTEEPIPLGG